MGKIFACIITLLALNSYMGSATDPNQLQDFCVATNDPNAAAFVNGLFCKSQATVTADDFLFQGLHTPRNTNNKFGSTVTLVSAANLPGLNTLGISVARIDFAPNGLNPPHIHPRATEILTVVDGTLLVGFVTSNRPNNAPNQLFTKVVQKGDVFVFPQGLIHFQLNTDANSAAVATVALSSQNPGVITVPNAIFGSKPAITVDVLTKTFQVDKNIINTLLNKFQTLGIQFI